MTATVANGARRWVVALVIVALAAVSAGCSAPAESSGTGSTAPAAPPEASATVPVVLRFGDHVTTAALADTPESQQLAAMLPATVQLKDVWGQAKSGPLPHELTVGGSTPVHDPVPGGIYFWPSTEVIAIYYTDLGQTVPSPGLVRLGAIDTGLDSLAHAAQPSGGWDHRCGRAGTGRRGAH